ncbi:hypothetical protein [Burkholderia ubonensis]|uniref:hypothetical protein n=1 Tax=Burkholderia ubonensis TaxID=101571 RepID=UPI0012F76AF5|nr:hypothetical protein [Burkholderia ubonensis]
MFDRKAHIGVDPIFLGSVFPVRSQWNWITATIGLNLVTTVGLFRGWGWARWLSVILCIFSYIIAAPVRDVHLLPSFFFMLAGSVLAYWFVFFSPKVKIYFARPTDGQPIFAIRGAISTILLAFAVFTAHSIVMGVFRKTLPVEIAWFGVGVFILPVLLLILVIRWHLEISLREISAFLLSVATFFAYSLFSTFLALHFAYSDAVMPYFGWLHSALLTLAFGAGGLLLDVYIARRYRVART